VKDDRLYLLHIVESMERIAAYTAGGRDSYLSDRKTQDAVVRNLQTLAESTQRLAPDLKARHPEIDWVAIAGLRNVLVHDYLGVNQVRVWEIVEQSLPGLKHKVSAIQRELDAKNSGAPS